MLLGLCVFLGWQPMGQMQANGQATMQRPIVIAHRGASGFLPEHTLGAYQLAILQGADFIEPDLVVTRDGVLIARHENELSTTTDIVAHPEFADCRTTKTIDGVVTSGWFSEDFSLAEIKMLRARERIPDIRPHNTQFDASFTVPTLSEILRLVRLVERTTGRKIGLYPETKHPTYFAHAGTHLDGAPINLSLGQLLVDALVAEDFTDPSRVFIQSFEFANLIELHTTIMPQAGIDLPLIQLYGDMRSRPYDMVFHAGRGAGLQTMYGPLSTLVEGGISPRTGYRALTTPAVLDALAETYASGVGAWKNSLVADQSLAASPFLTAALKAGLRVYPYTFRAEAPFLARNPDGSRLTMDQEIQHFLDLGIHGFFTDQPNRGVAARDRFLTTTQHQGDTTQ